ncbi:MAG: nucleoside deaminase [Desulfuromonas thiophila]|uniref:nucleoside deaminase n=1 Tax=Desulfuromonas thiophila TaxID=57664 RepID=UPI0024A8920A|nr:nucleoside deaminase [Desulfuromonas thiophila]MDD3802523.1 nucleoside deaminase [Desulfuromonas thiophila]
MNLAPFAQCCLSLPTWLLQAEREVPILADAAARMRWVLALARRNSQTTATETAGGPFAAAVFDADSGALICAGVNRVIPSCCSAAHAEMVALMRAQQRLGQHRLDLLPPRRFELVSSTEPCAMCLGALPWAGIHRLLCGARDEDARAIGFDEGDKPDRWQDKLQQRGIAVDTDLCRSEAIAVLQDYARQQGQLY